MSASEPAAAQGSSGGLGRPGPGLLTRGPGSPFRRLISAAIGLLLPGLTLLALLGAWALLAAQYGPAVVPGPSGVLQTFLELWRGNTFQPAFIRTLEEAVLGWFAGSMVALPIGYSISRWRRLDRAFGPYLAASQALPVVAIAPLLLEWIGLGIELKVVIAAIISFFPVAITTATGIRSIDRDARDVARVFGANWWQTLIHLEMPRAARSVLSGERIAATLAVTGAFVGELINPDQGLGALIQSGLQGFDTSEVFVGFISLMIMGAGLYGAITAVERRVVRWTD